MSTSSSSTTTCRGACGLSRAAWVLVYLLAEALFALAQGPSGRAAELLAQAREAYERRDEPGAAALAVDLFEQAIRAGAGYEALWEGARAADDLSALRLPETARERDRIQLFEKGMALARAAIALEPGRPEGHLYYVVNLGEKIDRAPFWQQLRFASEIRREAELAAAYGPDIECGLPMSVLGLYLMRAPRAFGGDRERGLTLLDRAVQVCPEDVQNRLDLAEGLAIAGRRAKAMAELEWILGHEPATAIAKADYARQRAQAEQRIATLRKRKVD